MVGPGSDKSAPHEGGSAAQGSPTMRAAHREGGRRSVEPVQRPTRWAAHPGAGPGAAGRARRLPGPLARPTTAAVTPVPTGDPVAAHAAGPPDRAPRHRRVDGHARVDRRRRGPAPAGQRPWDARAADPRRGHPPARPPSTITAPGRQSPQTCRPARTQEPGAAAPATRKKDRDDDDPVLRPGRRRCVPRRRGRRRHRRRSPRNCSGSAGEQPPCSATTGRSSAGSDPTPTAPTAPGTESRVDHKTPVLPAR